MKKRTLSVVTYLSLAVFFLILFGLIFTVAGSARFLQGWLYGLSFCVPTLLITVYFLAKDPALIERRIRPVETRPKQVAGQSLAALLFFGGIIVMPALDHRLMWTSLPLWLSILADGMVLAGFLLVFAVFRANTFTSRAIELMEGQQVITTGPYALVRHPMYSGAALIILFTPVAMDSLTGLIFSALLIVVIVLRILDEEKLLLGSLEGYADYCQQTRYRLLPHFW